jgi:hypothetical protein
MGSRWRGRHRIDFGRGPRGERHGGTRFSESSRNACADPAAATGDESDLAREQEFAAHRKAPH